jgi:hypothetical protein
MLRGGCGRNVDAMERRPVVAPTPRLVARQLSKAILPQATE